MLGELFKNKRKEMGYTIDEVCRMCDITKPTLMKLERSEDLKGLTKKTVIKVSEALNIDANNFIDDNEVEILDSDFILNDSNYHGSQARRIYCGASQFKSFLKCEAEALAEINEDIEPLETKSLLEGSYMDARVEGKEAFRQFREHHPEIYTNKGELKSEFKKADLAYDRVNQDEMFMSYLEGDKQVIMTGEIGGIKYKIKIDNLNLEKGIIVDLKYIKDFEMIWDDKDKVRKHFIEYWGYDIQGAIYQEIARQNIGVRLPFYIAAITKEENTDYNVFEIAQKDLDEALKLVEEMSPHIDRLKKGEEKPVECGHCRYCKANKKLSSPTIYTKFIEELI